MSGDASAVKMEKKIIFTSGASILITALLVLGGVELNEPDVYACEARNIIMPCDSLSQYYSIPNGKCRNSELGNKLCRTGWTQDFIVEDEIAEPEDQTIPDCPVKVIAYTDNGKYFCDCIGAGCPCIHTDEILSELG